MDYNQFQVHFPYYQSISSSQQTQRNASTPQMSNSVAGYFHLQQDASRSIPSPVPSYQIGSSSMGMDHQQQQQQHHHHVGNSPLTAHRVIVSPQHQQHQTQSSQHHSQPQQQISHHNMSNSSSTSNYIDFSSMSSTIGQNYQTSLFQTQQSASLVDTLTQMPSSYYQAQSHRQQSHVNNESPFFSTSRSSNEANRQTTSSPGYGMLFSSTGLSENSSSNALFQGRAISSSNGSARVSLGANSHSMAPPPRRIATRPLVSSSSLLISSAPSDSSAFGSGKIHSFYNNNTNNNIGEDIFSTAVTCDPASNGVSLKTPMALIVDLAKRHKVRVNYQTISEKFATNAGGSKLFTVCLQLGDERHMGIGNSIPRAQQNAAQEALRSSSYVSSAKLPRPTDRRKPTTTATIKPSIPLPSTTNNESASASNATVPAGVPNNKEASMTHTVELNALAMKYRLKVIYEDRQMKRSAAVGKPQVGYFLATCQIGNYRFSGEGPTRKDARQASAKAALESLKTKTADELLAEGTGTPPNLQSEISQVYDFAARRGLAVKFTVDVETPLPDQTFVTVASLACPDGELQAVGRGRSKKEAKQKACAELLLKIRQIPSAATAPPGTNVGTNIGTQNVPLSLVEAIRGTSNPWRQPGNRNPWRLQQPANASRKQATPDFADPNFGIDLNPISRLYQIRQAAKDGVLPAFSNEILDDKAPDVNNAEPAISTTGEITAPSEQPATTITATSGQYHLLLRTPAGSHSQPIQGPLNLNRASQKRSKFSVRCSCGEKTVVGFGPTPKEAKIHAATEMLKMLNYIVPPPSTTEEGDQSCALNAKTSKSADDVVKKKRDRRKRSEEASNVPLYFHPALFAPPTSTSYYSGLLTANNLVGPNPANSNGISGSDITLVAKKIRGMKKVNSVKDMLKFLEELGASKLENISLPSSSEDDQAEMSSSFLKLQLLCALAGRTVAITRKSNNATHLVFVNVADATFCGEGASDIEALESVAQRLVESIANTQLQQSAPPPPIILTEEDLVPQSEMNTTTNISDAYLPTALMVAADDSSISSQKASTDLPNSTPAIAPTESVANDKET